MTGIGSFDNSTCKRVLNLLEPGDLRLGQVVIKRVAVVKLGVNNGSGVGGSCFGIEVWTDTAKLTDMVCKMAAVRHLGFVGRLLEPPTMTNGGSLSLCLI